MSVARYNAGVPDNIVRIIKERGMKQCAVAERAGFSQQQFSDMLKGRRIIKPCDVMVIASVLEVDISDLFATGHGGV